MNCKMLHSKSIKDEAVCVAYIPEGAVNICMSVNVVERVPIDGSSRLGFFQLRVTVLPVMDSITGVPSGGSGRTSAKKKGKNPI